MRSFFGPKALLLAAALVATQAQAELIEADWQSAGDNLVTIDSISGQQWLDLTVTDGMSITQVQEQLDSTFAGWRLPTRAEVTALMENTFQQPLAPNQTYTPAGSSSHLVSQFSTYFGKTTSSYTYGRYINDQQAILGGTASLVVTAYDPNTGHDTIRVHGSSSGDLSHTHNSIGVFLVRDGVADVPGPVGLGALILGLAGLAGWRRRSHHHNH